MNNVVLRNYCHLPEIVEFDCKDIIILVRRHFRVWKNFLFMNNVAVPHFCVRSCRHAACFSIFHLEYIRRSFLVNNFQSLRELKERRRSKEKYVKKIYRRINSLSFYAAIPW